MTSCEPTRKPPRNPKPPVRVPLPRQKGGVHEDRTKRPFRRRKHRKRDDPPLRDDDASTPDRTDPQNRRPRRSAWSLT